MIDAVGRVGRVPRVWAEIVPERLRVPLSAFVASRVLFLVAGYFGGHYIRAVGPGDPWEPPGALGYWAHWDGAWYLLIARHGYHERWPAAANFFPGYALAVRLVSTVTGHLTVVAVGLSLVFCAAALYFVHELALDLFGKEAARAATLALAFFPTSFFLNAAYSEPLFVAAAAGAVWAGRVRGDFLLAGVLGGIASGTRSVGIILLIPLAYEWLRRRRDVRPWRPAAIVLTASGLAAWMAYCRHRSGDALLFLTTQRTIWGHHNRTPWATAEWAWDAASKGAYAAVHPVQVLTSPNWDLSFNAMDTYNLVFMVVLIALLVGVIVWCPPGLAAYAVLAAVAPLPAPPFFSPLAGTPRYMLDTFPIFLVLGRILARRQAWLRVWLFASAASGVLLTLFFTSWRWVA